MTLHVEPAAPLLCQFCSLSTPGFAGHLPKVKGQPLRKFTNHATRPAGPASSSDSDFQQKIIHSSLRNPSPTRSDPTNRDAGAIADGTANAMKAFSLGDLVLALAGSGACGRSFVSGVRVSPSELTVVHRSCIAASTPTGRSLIKGEAVSGRL